MVIVYIHCIYTMTICCEGSSSKAHKHTPYTVYVLATRDPNTLECSKKGEKVLKPHVWRIPQKKQFEFWGNVTFFRGQISLSRINFYFILFIEIYYIEEGIGGGGGYDTMKKATFCSVLVYKNVLLQPK